MFLIGIAGKAAAADEDPDVDIPVVETLVVPISNIILIFECGYEWLNFEFRHIQ